MTVSTSQSTVSAAYYDSEAIIRPNRFVSIIAIPQSINAVCQEVRKALSATTEHCEAATKLGAHDRKAA